VTYKLRFDRSQHLVFDVSPDVLEQAFGEDYFFMLDEDSWQDFWKPIEVQFYNDSDSKKILTPPDITLWFTDQLVLNEKAYNSLQIMLAPYGEFLPVTCEGIAYWILHVTQKTGMDAIDDEHSMRLVEASGFVDVKQLAFKPSAVNSLPLFKSEYDGFKNLYCSETFKQQVESCNLNGLVFSDTLASIF
jgi:hypothetical protein